MLSLTTKSHITVASAPNLPNGGPRVYRFVVTDPKLGGGLHKIKPTLAALAIRPTAPVQVVNSTPVIPQAQPKAIPPTAQSKETAVNRQVKPEPSSNSIHQQLAQIGIDAIAAQAHVCIMFHLHNSSEPRYSSLFFLFLSLVLFLNYS